MDSHQKLTAVVVCHPLTLRTFPTIPRPPTVKASFVILWVPLQYFQRAYYVNIVLDIPSWFPHLQSWPLTTCAPGNIPMASNLFACALGGIRVLHISLGHELQLCWVFEELQLQLRIDQVFHSSRDSNKI